MAKAEGFMNNNEKTNKSTCQIVIQTAEPLHYFISGILAVAYMKYLGFR